MTGYDFEVDGIIKRVRGSKARRVGLQFPEGLKEHAIEVARRIEDETSAKVIVFADQTYGACDLKESQSGKLGIDLLVHFGHTRY